MKATADPLLDRPASERLHFATGELLGADDFRDEQTYHRRQLAQSLLFLCGSGTCAGLRVVADHLPGTGGAPDDVELIVRAGLAIDRAGRLVEIPRDACLRLRRWYEYLASLPPNSNDLDVADLRAAYRPDAGQPGRGTVIVDLFLTFHACPRGYTPAFASGPFDALDASQPSRLRDAYELTLVPRRLEEVLAAGFDYWAGVTSATLAGRIFDSYEAQSLGHADQVVPANPTGVDATAVLLARITLAAQAAPDAASAPVPDWSAAAWPEPNPETNPDNRVRPLAVPPAALRHLL